MFLSIEDMRGCCSQHNEKQVWYMCFLVMWCLQPTTISGLSNQVFSNQDQMHNAVWSLIIIHTEWPKAQKNPCTMQRNTIYHLT